MRRNALGLLACALTLATAPAAAQPASVGETPEGELILDLASPYDREGDGTLSVDGLLRLRTPFMEAGRIIDVVEVTYDWNCRTGEFREASRSYLTRAGDYVRTELPRSEWTFAPQRGPLARADVLICAAPPPRTLWLQDRPRRRTEAQVVELPKVAGAF